MTYRIGNEMINSGETFIKYLIGVKNIGMSKIQSKIGCILIEKKKDISKLSLFFFFSSTQGLHAELLHQPFFVKGFFEIGSLELFALNRDPPDLCFLSS
jgi:hypothetical protein